MLKKALLRGLFFFALVISAGYLLLFPPLPLPPEIGRDLPNNFSEAKQQFERRVKAEFQLPISEGELTSRLEAQGFTVITDNNFAVFEKPRFLCTLVWRVHWETQDVIVSSLSTVYGGICV